MIWGKSTSLNQIVKLQKKSIRIVHAKPYNYHTEPLLKSSGILRVQDQYILNTLIFMYQLKYNKLPNSFHTLEYFRQRSQPYTRQIGLAKCERPRTIFSSLLPYHQFPRIWNELDASNHEIPSLGRFKSKVKFSLIEKYVNIVHCSPASITSWYHNGNMEVH